MKAKNKFNKRKKLEQRCPECGSSQIHYRTLLQNWKCDNKNCGKTFKQPKGDE